jgi:aldose 1-epimerase
MTTPELDPEFDIVSISSPTMRLEAITLGASAIGLYIGDSQFSVIRALLPALYPTHSQHFGAIAGPVANRIGNGRAPCGTDILQLEKNEAGNHSLHSGHQGTGRQIWQCDHHAHSEISFSLFQPDMMLGFPGNRQFTCTYSLGQDEQGMGWLDVRLSMVSDKKTLCNMAFHPYFCLDNSGDILSHRLQLSAYAYLATDDENLPTGELIALAGSDFDFRNSTRLRTLANAPLLDHNFCLEHAQEGLSHALSLHSDISGLRMDVETNQPGMQIYCPKQLNQTLKSRTEPAFGAFPAICIEPQNWPDAPNNGQFPDIEIDADQRYENWSRFRFSSP